MAIYDLIYRQYIGNIYHIVPTIQLADTIVTPPPPPTPITTKSAY